MEEIQKEQETDKIQELSRQIEELKQSTTSNALPLPVAIVVASVLIAGSVIYATSSYKNYQTASLNNPSNNVAEEQISVAKPATSDDHILGNKDAPVKIVEYSDLECPFCKVFHQTMTKIMDEYGQSGKVAWVYRHFPLDQLHSKARNEARATECATAQGGNNAFWNFTNKLFEITPSNDGLDSTELPRIAEAIGLDKIQFTNCLASKKYDDRIAKNEQGGLDSGARGTPYSILFTPNGSQIVINGAQSYEYVKTLIDKALAEK